MIKTRQRFATPTTPMERDVEGLVRYLRTDAGSRQDFAEAVDAVMARAFVLEKTVEELRKENDALWSRMAPRIPPMICDSQSTLDVHGRLLTFDWIMERIRYRVVIDCEPPPVPAMLNRIKRKAYRGIAKALRIEFERTWCINNRLFTDTSQ